MNEEKVKRLKDTTSNALRVASDVLYELGFNDPVMVTLPNVKEYAEIVSIVANDIASEDERETSAMDLACFVASLATMLDEGD